MQGEKIPEDLPQADKALVLRWRLSNCTLIAAGRHLKTLKTRWFAPGLESWCREHIEWTLLEGAADNPNGVLVILVDTAGRSAMLVDPFVELSQEARTLESLFAIAHDALPTLAQPDPHAVAAHLAPEDGAGMRVGDTIAPSVLWATTADKVVCYATPGTQLSGINALVADLVATKGYSLSYRDPQDPTVFSVDALREADEIVLVSDEFGMVGATGYEGPFGEFLDTSYNKLVEATACKNKNARRL